MQHPQHHRRTPRAAALVTGISNAFRTQGDLRICLAYWNVLEMLLLLTQSFLRRAQCEGMVFCFLFLCLNMIHVRPTSGDQENI